MTTNGTATIFVVDDDPALRRALEGVGQVLGCPVASFASAAEFLDNHDPDQPGCLVLDIKMPGISGLELQQLLRDRKLQIPLIMISGHADVRIAVEAMRQGALTLLEKPFSMADLLTYLRLALAQDAAQRTEQRRMLDHADQAPILTAKEREVLEKIVAGKTNKEIALALKLSIRAVEDRRSRLMKRFRVRSVAELVLAASRHGFVPTDA